jgi:peptidoglycan/LPS O-acetylase OafA/YrhL
MSPGATFMKDMRHRIRPLDGLRGIAILMVVLSHLGASIDGAVGVQIFFVISGYLISSHILAEILISGKFDFKHFYLRRFARLFPTLLLVSILTVVFLIAYKIPLKEWKLGPLGALTSTMNFIQIFLGNENVSWAFQFTWSLSVEEQFYLIWPVTLWCTFELPRNGLQKDI